jgi:hypothetical protein
LYIYDAVSTAVHNALRGKNSKAKEYAKQPYNFENKEKSEFEKAKEVEIEQEISTPTRLGIILSLIFAVNPITHPFPE